MKRLLFFSFIFLSCFTVIAQDISERGNHQSNRMAYAVTDSVREGACWKYLRTINLRTGEYGNVLTRLLNSDDTATNGGTFLCNSVAAIAHDKRNKRIYFTAMLTDRLSYVDLRNMRIYTAKNNFTGLMPKAADQSNVITRMVITGDDLGYVLTNDGNHLIRFTTRNNIAVTDLGALTDAPGNIQSVHSPCSSFGGDLVADDDDHLYLITSRNHVFKINTRTRVARFLGTVNNLAEGFTTSGAAVDPQTNRIVLTSSNNLIDVYSFSVVTLNAQGLDTHRPWFASDLANSAELNTGRGNHQWNKNGEDEGPGIFVDINEERSDSIKVYPNPVTTGEFKVQFLNTLAGSYTVEVIDARGRLLMSKAVSTSGKNSIINILMPGINAKGICIVRIIDKNNNEVFSEKVIFQ